MTNKEFEQKCKRSFKLLNKEKQMKIINKYFQEEVKLSGTQLGFYFPKILKENKPRGKKKKENADQKLKFYLWYHNNYMMSKWRDTYFEIANAITSPPLRDSEGVVKEIYDDANHASTPRLWELAEQWTDKFESQYTNYDWAEHGDYYEKIEEFCEKENKKGNTYE